MNTSLTWHDVIGVEKQQEYFQQTLSFVEAERAAGKVVFPPASDVFNAFKATEFADVNPVPHLWSRAKEDYRHAAHRLLRDFMQQMVAACMRVLPLPPPPRRLVPRPIALADFQGTEYGPEYLNLTKGDVVLPARVPEGVDAEGWAYGSLNGKLGWYPESFVADA